MTELDPGLTQDQPGHLHRMVADWDCIVRNWLSVADGRVKPRAKPGQDGVEVRLSVGMTVMGLGYGAELLGVETPSTTGSQRAR